MRHISVVAIVASLILVLPLDGAVRRRAVRSPGPPALLPVGVNDAFATSRDTALTTPAPGVLGNDTLNNATITSYGASSGTEQTTLGSPAATFRGGTVTLSANGSFTYTPPNAFVGSDELKYVLTNAAGNFTATVTITVLPPPPTAAADSFAATQNTTLSVPAPGVLSNDTLQGASITSYGQNGTEQTTLGASTPTTQQGTVRLNADGGFVYDPPSANFTGSDVFRYLVANAGGNATAVVTINVQPSGPDFTVTSPGFFFQFGTVPGQNPVLTLKRGRTYTFRVNSSFIHPFRILDAPEGSVTNNDISIGTVTFVVPLTAASYRYDCSIHQFGNVINTIP